MQTEIDPNHSAPSPEIHRRSLRLAGCAPDTAGLVILQDRNQPSTFERCRLLPCARINPTPARNVASVDGSGTPVPVIVICPGESVCMTTLFPHGSDKLLTGNAASVTGEVPAVAVGNTSKRICPTPTVVPAPRVAPVRGIAKTSDVAQRLPASRPRKVRAEQRVAAEDVRCGGRDVGIPEADVDICRQDTKAEPGDRNGGRSAIAQLHVEAVA